MIKAGKSLASIASERDLNLRTINSHIAKLHEEGDLEDISPYISMEEVNTISKAFRYVEQPIKLKDVYLYLNEQYDYDKIRLALAAFNRKKSASIG
jgi:ATP-dependent DNA helicase RecQ